MAPDGPDDIRCFLRAPIFPIVARIGDKTWVARTVEDFKSVVAEIGENAPEECDVIDYRWEGWTFLFQQRMFSPLCVKKRWTKKEFLALCGVPEKQLDNIDLNRYTRKEVFDYVIQNSKKG